MLQSKSKMLPKALISKVWSPSGGSVLGDCEGEA